MTSEVATLAIFDVLSGLEIPFMIVGSLSSHVYGIPRSTKDTDIVVELGDRFVSEIAEGLGPAFQLDPQMSFETVTGTLRNELEVVGEACKIAVFQISDDPHDCVRFKRHVLGREAWVPTAEDVTVTKLRRARSKDSDNIRDGIAVEGDAIDWEYAYTWTDCHGTRELVDEIRA